MHEARAQDESFATRLGQLARSLQTEADTDTMLLEIVAAAVRLIPGADAASISVVRRRHEVRSEYASSELARTVDELQTEVEQGPGLDAIGEQRTVRVPDMRSEARWPNYARRAHDLGVGSMLSFQLSVQDDTLGALNLFNHRASAFGEESEHVGLIFASHAAVAFAGARNLDNLTLAVHSRDVIGQAKGMIMERYSIDAQQAFALLVRISSSSQRKLYNVAQELAATGRLEGLRGRSA